MNNQKRKDFGLPLIENGINEKDLELEYLDTDSDVATIYKNKANIKDIRENGSDSESINAKIDDIKKNFRPSVGAVNADIFSNNGTPNIGIADDGTIFSKIINVLNNAIINVPDGVNPQDVINKRQLDTFKNDVNARLVNIPFETFIKPLGADFFNRIEELIQFKPIGDKGDYAYIIKDVSNPTLEIWGWGVGLSTWIPLGIQIDLSEYRTKEENDQLYIQKFKVANIDAIPSTLSGTYNLDEPFILDVLNDTWISSVVGQIVHLGTIGRFQTVQMKNSSGNKTMGISRFISSQGIIAQWTINATINDIVETNTGEYKKVIFNGRNPPNEDGPYWFFPNEDLRKGDRIEIWLYIENETNSTIYECFKFDFIVRRDYPVEEYWFKDLTDPNNIINIYCNITSNDDFGIQLQSLGTPPLMKNYYLYRILQTRSLVTPTKTNKEQLERSLKEESSLAPIIDNLVQKVQDMGIGQDDLQSMIMNNLDVINNNIKTAQDNINQKLDSEFSDLEPMIKAINDNVEETKQVAQATQQSAVNTGVAMGYITGRMGGR